jgi:hypothetical protein
MLCEKTNGWRLRIRPPKVRLTAKAGPALGIELSLLEGKKNSWRIRPPKVRLTAKAGPALGVEPSFAFELAAATSVTSVHNDG